MERQTTMAKPSEVKRAWYVVDAKDLLSGVEYRIIALMSVPFHPSCYFFLIAKKRRPPPRHISNSRSGR